MIKKKNFLPAAAATFRARQNQNVAIPLLILRLIVSIVQDVIQERMDQEPSWTTVLRHCLLIKWTPIPMTQQGLALQLMNKEKSWKKFNANKDEDPFPDPEPPMTMIHPIVTEPKVVIQNIIAVRRTLMRI